MKKFQLICDAKVIDAETGEVVVSEHLSYTAHGAAIHDGIAKMMPSMTYGLTVSLSSAQLGLKEEKREAEKK